jgi:hypothetical protein
VSAGLDILKFYREFFEQEHPNTSGKVEPPAPKYSEVVASNTKWWKSAIATIVTVKTKAYTHIMLSVVNRSHQYPNLVGIVIILFFGRRRV